MRAGRVLRLGTEFLDVVEDGFEEVVLLAFGFGDLRPGRAKGAEHILGPGLDADDLRRGDRRHGPGVEKRREGLRDGPLARQPLERAIPDEGDR